MLCLDRKKGEGIVIGEGIRVVVVDLGGGRVKLGIEAPKDVKVLRAELVPTSSTRDSSGSNTPG